MVPSQSRNAALAALAFFLAWSLVIGSGRMDTSDGLSQLRAATGLALTGSLGRPAPPTEDAGLWGQAPAGDWYEAHDIGAALFLTPAAWSGARLSGMPAREAMEHPPAAARVAAALCYSLLGGTAIWLLFLIWSQFYTLRAAWLVSAVAVSATPFLAYTRASWDVMGGCAGMALLLAASAAALKPAPSACHLRYVIGIGCLIAVALALTASFRLSLLPFFLPPVLILWFVTLCRISGPVSRKAASVFTWLATFATLMAPAAWYNAVRSGDPFHSAVTGHYAAADALHGDWVHGLYGLLLSPNRGLLPFAPAFLLLAALPVVWRRIDPALRFLIGWFGAGTVAYILALAKMQNWSGGAGWGPRYLVPVLPVLLLAAVPVAVELWRRWPLCRAWVAALTVASVVVNIPPVLVNYTLASEMRHGAFDPDSRAPDQQIAAWNALGLWMHGGILRAPSDAGGDPVRRLAQRGPFDFWLIRLVQYPATRAAGLPAAALLLGFGGWAGAVLWRISSAHTVMPRDG